MLRTYLKQRSPGISLERMLGQRIWFLALVVRVFGQLVDLNTTNFDDKIASGGGWFVMFHVDWCGICKKTFPQFEKAAGESITSENIDDKFRQVTFGHVDSSNDKTLAHRYDVKGYPTLLWWDEGAKEPRTFRGFRSMLGFQEYAKKMSRYPTVSKTRDLEWNGLLEKVEKSPLASFVHVKWKKDDEVQEGFAKFAEKHRDVHTFYEAEKGQYEQLAVPGNYIVTAKLHSHQTEIRQYEENGSQKLEDWLYEYRFPGVWWLTDVNFFDFTHGVNTCVIFVVNLKETNPDFLQRAKEKFDGTGINVGLLDGVSWADTLKDFHLYEEELPRVWITKDKMEYWYEDKDLLSVEELYKMLDGVSASDGVKVKESLDEKLNQKFPILMWQKRGWISTLVVTVRTALRMLNLQKEWVETGEFPTTKIALFAVGFVLLTIVVSWLLWWILKAVCEALWEDDTVAEEEIRRAVAAQRKKER